MSPPEQLAVSGLPPEPFPVFFREDCASRLHGRPAANPHDQKPLAEEYSVAAQVWKMSAADLCEVARNSVLNSDFPHGEQHWVGARYWESGQGGNDIKRTNVPNVRVQFRHDVLEAEKALNTRESRKPQPKDARCRFVKQKSSGERCFFWFFYATKKRPVARM